MNPQEQPKGEVEQRDLDAVVSGYERWNSGDIAGLKALFDDGIVYENAPEWPGQNVYRGADDVVRFLEDEVAKIIALRPVEVVKTETIGTEIVLELSARTRGFLSGLDMAEETLFHVASVHDGKVARVRVYLDRDQAVRAAETGEG